MASTISTTDYDGNGVKGVVGQAQLTFSFPYFKQEDVKVGQWVMVAHGRWSRAFKVVKEGNELEVRMIDENDILLVSDEEPAHNRKKAGYVNTGGMKQMTSLPGND